MPLVAVTPAVILKVFLFLFFVQPVLLITYHETYKLKINQWDIIKQNPRPEVFVLMIFSTQLLGKTILRRLVFN